LQTSYKGTTANSGAIRVSNADTKMRTGFVAILLGVCLLAIIPASLAQSDIADVLTTQASSEIGNPLRAQINVGSLPSLRGDISVSLASQGAFEAFEIGRYQILSSLRFALRMNSAENYLLDIFSARPLNEPSLRFVVAFTGDGETSLMPIEVLIPVLDATGLQRPTLLSRPNETLWRIANRTRDDDITNAQQMLAVQQLNPESFRGNNIN
jgi:Tfp pilus assembly protein FimV